MHASKQLMCTDKPVKSGTPVSALYVLTSMLLLVSNNKQLCISAVLIHMTLKYEGLNSCQGPSFYVFPHWGKPIPQRNFHICQSVYLPAISLVIQLSIWQKKVNTDFVLNLVYFLMTLPQC
jgi:hypothetical protein